MLSKDIQEVRINVIEVLLAACKDEPETMYARAEGYLKYLQDSIQQNKNFYNQEYKG